MQINQKRFEFWSEQMKLWKESNLSQAVYCKNNNLDQQLFSKWKIRILNLNDDQKTKLVRIPAKLKNDFSVNGQIELIIKDKYKINIHSGFDQNTLKSLMETIEGFTS